MIDTLIILLAFSPLAIAIAWYITETQEINLHKQEMEEQWDLYAEESKIPSFGRPGDDLSPNSSWSPETKSRWKLYKQRNNL